MYRMTRSILLLLILTISISFGESLCSECVPENTASCDEGTDICVCQPGWMGSTCDTPTCIYGQVACLNGGICGPPGPNHNLCICVDPLYTGNMCQCKTSGTASVSGGICNCLPNWSGDYCDTCAPGYQGGNCDEPKCNATIGCTHDGSCSIPSGQNYGTCECVSGSVFQTGSLCQCHSANTLDVTGSTCNCRTNWTGADCNTCSIGTICHTCANGWWGDDCQCSLNGTLSISGNTCNCRPHWTGGDCNTCSSDWMGQKCQCATAGTESVDGETCVCKDHYTGADCNLCTVEWEGDNCEISTGCNLDGTMATQDNVYHKCICYPEWLGRWCTHPNTLCNISNMVSYSNGRCNCKPQWRGRYCDQRYCTEQEGFERDPIPCTEPAVCMAIGYCSDGCDPIGTASVTTQCNCKPNYGSSSDCITNTCGGVFYPESDQCNEQGTCVSGACQCDPGWGGSLCTIPCNIEGTSSITTGCNCNTTAGWSGQVCNMNSCPGAIGTSPNALACSGHGDCIGATSTCQCEWGWRGTSSCGVPTCGELWYSNCTDRGECDLGSGCTCDVTGTGQWCQIDTNCNVNNTLEYINDTCVCKDPWVGEHCDSCPPNWSGDNCEIHTCPSGYEGDECQCWIDGTESIGDDNSTCVCKYHFIGGDCGNCLGGWQPPDCATCPFGGIGPNCTLGTGCNPTGTETWDPDNSQCVCKFGYMLPYCCDYGFSVIESQRGPCLFGGVRACDNDQFYEVNSTGSYCTHINTANEAFDLAYPLGVVQLGGVLICKEGHDSSQKCCPYGQTATYTRIPELGNQYFYMCSMVLGRDTPLMIGTVEYANPSYALTRWSNTSRYVSKASNDQGDWILREFDNPVCFDSQCRLIGCPIGGGANVTLCTCAVSGPWNDETSQVCFPGQPGSPCYILPEHAALVNNCINGGICNGGTCECTNGWTGPTCQIPDCNIDGSRFDNMTTLTHLYITLPVCECNDGWSGQSCACPPLFRQWGSTISDDLLECGGLGVCNMTTNGGYCDCASGYGGTYCCLDNCNNHGKCSMNWNTMIPYCRCDKGYTGTSCGTQQPCPSNCNGHGTCGNYHYYDIEKLDYQLDYQGDHDKLINNITIVSYGTLDYVFEPYHTGDDSMIDTMKQFASTVVFRMERDKAVIYGTFDDWVYGIMHHFNFQSGPTFNSTFMDIVKASLLSVRLEDNVYGLSMMMIYPTLYSSTLPLTIGPAPSMDRPERSCVCNLGYSGPSCIGTCVTSYLNSKPCTSISTGDWHGVCIDGSSSCLCGSRWGGSSGCEVFRGNGCFESLDINVPCNNRGSCVVSSWGNSSCSCQAGSTGTYCDEYLCSADSPDIEIRRTQCNDTGGLCKATGICDCNTAVQLAKLTPTLWVGKDCRQDGFANCANQVSSIWRQCNSHGTCLVNTTTLVPYCQCNNGWSGNKCLTSLCNPECNSHQLCNVGTGTCFCQPKWSGASCQTSLCGAHGVPSEDGTSCICDDHYRMDSNGACNILQCPLAILTDQGTSACDASCVVSSALLSHQTGCCYDACVTALGASSCSNTTGTLTCTCAPPSAYDQIDGVCYSKCNGQTALPDTGPLGFRCECSTSFFIQTPWDPTIDLPLNPLCLRRRCLNGGTVSQSGTSCVCVNGYTGITCGTPPFIPSSTIASSAVISSSSSTHISSSSYSSTMSSTSPSTQQHSTGLPSISSGMDSSTSVHSTDSSTSHEVSSTLPLIPSSTADSPPGDGGSSSSSGNLGVAIGVPIATVAVFAIGIAALGTKCFSVPFVMPFISGRAQYHTNRQRVVDTMDYDDDEENRSHSHHNDGPVSTHSDNPSIVDPRSPRLSNYRSTAIMS